MEPMAIDTYLWGYALISGLVSLVPAVIAGLKGKNYYKWWLGSFFTLMATFFLNRNEGCFVAIIFLTILCVAAFVKSSSYSRT